MKPRNQRLFRKVLPYTIIWLLGGLIYYLLEKGIMGDATVYPANGNVYNPFTSLISISIVAVIVGTLLGILEEGFFKNLLRKQPFLFKVFLKTILYVSIIAIMITSSAQVLNSILLSHSLFAPEVIDHTINFITNFVFVSVLLYTGSVVGLSLFFSEMVDHIGLNAVLNFFTGRYSTSIIEERVFMFLDMKSSTTIAEKLGHEQYYLFLNTYYRDMTKAIVNTKGEIYQYVGDEIIISWKRENGLLDLNCLNCFTLIKKRIKKRETYYQDKFGIVPEFKAGLHIGDVTTGEVGVIKKEILFTGDVLNTTARIQGLCNELSSELLISGELKDLLNLGGKWNSVEKGSYELRGKGNKVDIFSLETTSPEEKH